MAKYKKPARKFSAVVYDRREKLTKCNGLHQVAEFMLPYYFNEAHGPYKYRTIINVIKEHAESTPNWSALVSIGDAVIKYCKICNASGRTPRALNSRQRATFRYVVAKTLEPHLIKYYERVNNKIGQQ